MPIRFRCSRCNRLLGIGRRKAGTATTCPHCGSSITVPRLEDSPQSELAEIDELLNPVSLAPAVASPEPVEAPWWQTAAPELPPPPPPPAPRPTAKPAPAATSKAKTDDERPLFERDLDVVLGTTPKPNGPEEAKQKPDTAAGADVLSLGDERGPIVLSVPTAMALAVAVVVLVVLSFVAGYLVASR